MSLRALEETAVATCRPFVKWAGGKTQLLDKIIPALCPDRRPPRGNFLEPFFGGGAVFFKLKSEKLIGYGSVISDTNDELMGTYAALAEYAGDVITALRRHAESHCEAYYYMVRDEEPTNKYAAAARLIYLNRTCYNGLYRVNKKGGFNVPFGNYKNPTIVDEPLLRACSVALKRTTIMNRDFSDVMSLAGGGDVVYCDPPYLPVSPTSFSAYTKGGFGLAKQEHLADEARQAVERGARVVLSNADTPKARELYSWTGFKIHEVQARRNINSKGSARGKVGELLIVGAPS